MGTSFGRIYKDENIPSVKMLVASALVAYIGCSEPSIDSLIEDLRSVQIIYQRFKTTIKEAILGNSSVTESTMESSQQKSECNNDFESDIFNHSYELLKKLRDKNSELYKVLDDQYSSLRQLTSKESHSAKDDTSQQGLSYKQFIKYLQDPLQFLAQSFDSSRFEFLYELLQPLKSSYLSPSHRKFVETLLRFPQINFLSEATDKQAIEKNKVSVASECVDKNPTLTDVRPRSPSFVQKSTEKVLANEKTCDETTENPHKGYPDMTGAQSARIGHEDQNAIINSLESARLQNVAADSQRVAARYNNGLERFAIALISEMSLIFYTTTNRLCRQIRVMGLITPENFNVFLSTIALFRDHNSDLKVKEEFSECFMILEDKDDDFLCSKIHPNQLSRPYLGYAGIAAQDILYFLPKIDKSKNKVELDSSLYHNLNEARNQVEFRLNNTQCVAYCLSDLFFNSSSQPEHIPYLAANLGGILPELRRKTELLVYEYAKECKVKTRKPFNDFGPTEKVRILRIFIIENCRNLTLLWLEMLSLLIAQDSHEGNA